MEKTSKRVLLVPAALVLCLAAPVSDNRPPDSIEHRGALLVFAFLQRLDPVREISS